MKKKMVYASQCGAVLDSNVVSGGGTDDTATLQAVLDMAKDGTQSVCLIMDGAALVTGLKVYSNTTIRCIDDNCGFFLAPNSNCPVIENAHRVLEGERLDQYITLERGVYNQNCLQQQRIIHYDDDRGQFVCQDGTAKTRDFVVGLMFCGVEHLKLHDITIRDQRTFAAIFRNWKHVQCENVFIDLPNKQHGTNQDGLHFFGPGQYLAMHNIHGCSSDDFIALAPDEADRHSSITDVLIDGVYLEDADQGIRMLCCHEGRLDRVTVKNVAGTYRSFGFFINPFHTDGTKEGRGYGNIVIDTVNMKSTAIDYTYTAPFLFRVGGHVEALTLRNIQHTHPRDNRYLVDVGLRFCEDHRVAPDWDPETLVDSLVIDGITAYEDDASSASTEYVRVHSGSVQSLTLKNVNIVRKDSCGNGGALVHICEDAKVKNLNVSDVYAEKVDTLLNDESKSTVRVQMHNVCLVK